MNLLTRPNKSKISLLREVNLGFYEEKICTDVNGFSTLAGSRLGLVRHCTVKTTIDRPLCIQVFYLRM